MGRGNAIDGASPVGPALVAGAGAAICNGRFVVTQDVLGEGTSAVVLRGIETATGLPVAVKRVALSTLSPAELKQVSQEIAFLQQYRHPNIIRLLDLQRTDEQFLLVLEYAESDLFSYITRTGALKEDQARFIFRQIVNAVSYLHSNRIAHRDLKLENFVVTSSGQVKIIDFGLSARVTPQVKLGDVCGSMAYSPPEIISHVPYDGTAADMWSLGIVLYALLLGGFPFYADDPLLMRDQILSGKLRFPKWLSMPARELIVSMLHRHPERRADIFDVAENAWLTQATPSPASPMTPQPPPASGGPFDDESGGGGGSSGKRDRRNSSGAGGGSGGTFFME